MYVIFPSREWLAPPFPNIPKQVGITGIIILIIEEHVTHMVADRRQGPIFKCTSDEPGWLAVLIVIEQQYNLNYCSGPQLVRTHYQYRQ